MKKIYEIQMEARPDITLEVEGVFMYRLFDDKKEAVSFFTTLKSFYTSDIMTIELSVFDQLEDNTLTNQTTIERYRVLNEEGK